MNFEVVFEAHGVRCQVENSRFRRSFRDLRRIQRPGYRVEYFIYLLLRCLFSFLRPRAQLCELYSSLEVKRKSLIKVFYL